MRIHTYPSLLAGAAMIALAAEADAGGGAAAPAVAPPKRYKVTAKNRTKDAMRDGETAELTFVVEGPDYKTAWQTARKVTRVGTAELDEGEQVYGIGEKGEDVAFTLRPGRYTVDAVDSLQERGKKNAPITLENLEAALEAKGVKLPKAIQDEIDKLKSNPGAVIAENAIQQQAAGTGS